MTFRKSIYDYAVGYGFTTSDKVAKAQKYEETNKCATTKALVDTAALTEENLLELLGKMYRYKVVQDIKKLKIDKALIERFDLERLIKLKMIPYAAGETCKVLLVNPNSSLMIEDYIKEILGFSTKVEYYLIAESSFNKYISSSGVSAIEYDLGLLENMESLSLGNDVYDVTDQDISVIVSLANRIFSEAARQKASDIHIEPYEERMLVRLRIDGILSQSMETTKRVHQQLVNRIKTMANMDINDTRRPQGGRIRLKLYGSYIDMRVSTLPTVFGEKLTIRLLDKNSVRFDISMIGFSPETERKFKNVIQKPSGMILITGPTGSGKSSSLYAAMDYLNNVSKCIVTLEDPVEYKLEGLVQIQVNSSANLTFSNGLREILRQDPDIILIGEIRDEETARIAVQASNTGHLVFATLHTNNAASSVLRFVEMGIEPFLVSTTLNAVVSQRLVRRICRECKEKYPIGISSPYHKVLNSNDEILLYRGRGCEECGGTGYKGRLAVQEFLLVDDEIRDELTRHTTSRKIQDVAVRNGMKTIQQDGIEKALAGFTTLDEVHRVLHFENLE